MKKNSFENIYLWLFRNFLINVGITWFCYFVVDVNFLEIWSPCWMRPAALDTEKFIQKIPFWNSCAQTINVSCKFQFTWNILRVTCSFNWNSFWVEMSFFSYCSNLRLNFYSLYRAWCNLSHIKNEWMFEQAQNVFFCIKTDSSK